VCIVYDMAIVVIQVFFNSRDLWFLYWYCCQHDCLIHLTMISFWKSMLKFFSTIVKLGSNHFHNFCLLFFICMTSVFLTVYSTGTRSFETAKNSLIHFFHFLPSDQAKHFWFFYRTSATSPTFSLGFDTFCQFSNYLNWILLELCYVCEPF
jgi:hypothetical protein